MRTSLALSIVLLAAAAVPSSAQSHYVGGAIVWDIARFTTVEIAGDNPAGILTGDQSADGEVVAGSVVLGTALGDRWGIEIEFVRGGLIENSSSEELSPRVIPVVPIPSPPSTTLPIPVFGLETSSEQRHTTVAAMAWIRQEVNPDFDLVYLGGLSFNHTDLTQRFRLTGDRILLGILGLSPFPDTDVDAHSVGPVVGVEGRWKLGDHVAIVPGLRVHGVSAGGRTGWLIRPSAGLRWRF
jgi:hypothetical protein